MSLRLNTGAMQYRESTSDSWKPLVIKANMNWESMADSYDAVSGTYDVGEYVLYNGVMYKCISAITAPEAWNSAHWDEVSVSEELELINTNFAGHYSSTSAYATGKYVLHEGELYRCIVRVASGGETWNSAHWSRVDIGTELKSFINYLATEYSSGSTYAEGKFCIYQGKLYKCISKISTAEEWNSSHWATTNLGDAIYNLKLNIAQPYSPTKSYAVGDVCMHGDALRRCTTAIPSGGETWNNSHWGYITSVMDIVGDGELDDSFTATTLTEAANQLRTSLNGLEDGLAIPQTSDNCNWSGGIKRGAFIHLTGNSDQVNLPDGYYQASQDIANTSAFTTSNLTRQYQGTGMLNTLYNNVDYLGDRTFTGDVSNISISDISKYRFMLFVGFGMYNNDWYAHSYIYPVTELLQGYIFNMGQPVYDNQSIYLIARIQFTSSTTYNLTGTLSGYSTGSIHFYGIR